jgi:hypothetical protein
VDQPVEFIWHGSRNLLEGGESGDSVHDAPGGRAASRHVGLIGGGWQSETVSCSRFQYAIAACCRRGMVGFAFAPLTGRIRTALPYLAGPGVQTVIERSGMPRAEADQSRSSTVYDNPGGPSP